MSIKILKNSIELISDVLIQIYLYPSGGLHLRSFHTPRNRGNSRGIELTHQRAELSAGGAQPRLYQRTLGSGSVSLPQGRGRTTPAPMRFPQGVRKAAGWVLGQPAVLLLLSLLHRLFSTPSPLPLLLARLPWHGRQRRGCQLLLVRGRSNPALLLGGALPPLSFVFRCEWWLTRLSPALCQQIRGWEMDCRDLAVV